MKRYKISTFLGEALKGIYRNPLSSFVSVISLVLALLIMGIFWMLKVNIDLNMSSLQDYRKIVVYMKTNATDAQIETTKNKLRTDFGVDDSGIEFTSKEDALLMEKKRYGKESAHIFDSFDGDINPLPDAFTVSYPEDMTDNTLTHLMGKISDYDGVDEVKNRKDIVDKIENLKNIVNTVSGALMIMLFFVSVFVIGNTVKLTHEARKSEIKIMRYIGATNFFIEFPFILEGVFLGIISALSSYAIIVNIYQLAANNITKNYGDIIKFVKLSDTAFPSVPGMNYYIFILAAFIITGLLTGILGTFTTKKHMKA